jgi:conjugal transfer pilus assembly protein TraK
MIRSKPRRGPRHLLPALPILLSPLLAEQACALQVVDAQDGATVVAKLSRQEITRIRFEHSRVRKVTGNAGEFVLEKDDERGEVFIRPTDPTTSKPVNLFISSDTATVALLLQPVDLPGDSVVIREPGPSRDAPSRLEASGQHVRTMKNLLLALADDSLPEDMTVHEPGREIALWPGTRFTLQRALMGTALVAEKFLLSNTGSAVRELPEQAFFKRGVMAISIERPSLAPGESTSVFVIRERGSND